VQQVFIDQVLWNPIFGIMFFGYMGMMSNMGVSGTINEIKTKLYSSVTGSWTVWPIAHTINFRFVPNQSRILYINSIQIFYNCFLSILASNKKE
jgi:protein Mpv17